MVANFAHLYKFGRGRNHIVAAHVGDFGVQINTLARHVAPLADARLDHYCAAAAAEKTLIAALLTARRALQTA